MLTYSETRNYDIVKQAIKSCDSSLSVFRIVPMHGKRNYTYYVNDNLVVQFPIKENDGTEIIDRSRALDYLAPRLPFRIGSFDVRIGEWNNKPLAMSVSPRIEGFTLTKTAFDSIDKRSKKYVFDQLAYFLTALHEISKEEMQPYNIPSSNKLIVNRLKEAHNFAPLLINFAKIFGTHECLCHNDCHTRNIHIDSAFNLLGVFDFDGLAFGNPVWDIAIPSYTYRDAKTFQQSYETESNRQLTAYDLAYMARYTVAKMASMRERIIVSRSQTIKMGKSKKSAIPGIPCVKEYTQSKIEAMQRRLAGGQFRAPLLTLYSKQRQR